jgi:archaellum biogenesis protein FlaJ (TadC family)
MTTWSELARRVSPAESDVPFRLRLAATALRIAFIALLLVVTVRVSMPQNETIWTIFDTPWDLVRLALGLAVCIGIVIQVLRTPVDANGYRTWVYLGLAAVPFALICIFAVW